MNFVSARTLNKPLRLLSFSTTIYLSCRVVLFIKYNKKKYRGRIFLIYVMYEDSSVGNNSLNIWGNFPPEIDN